MFQHNRSSTAAIVVGVSTLAVLLCVGTVATATNVGVQTTDQNTPDNAEEYIVEFQTLSGAEFLESYSEYEIIRSQAIQDAQVGEFSQEKEQRLQHVLEILTTFSRAFEARNQGSFEDALSHAGEVRETTNQLRSVERGEQYAPLSDIALDRFYEQAAQTLLTQAENNSRTPEQVDILTQAATAYSRAGATDRFAQVELRADEREQQFQVDFDQINATNAEVDQFLTDCRACDSVSEAITTSPLKTFTQYGEALSAVSAGDEGATLADRHGLTGLESDLEAKRDTASSYRETLAVASTGLVLGYSTAVGLLVALVTWRLMLWRRDFVASQRGDVILMGEMLRA